MIVEGGDSAATDKPAPTKGSHGEIFTGTLIIGAATVATTVAGLIRNKAIALLLGPAGLGLIGLLNNLIATASNVSAMGIGMAGVRDIAESAEDADPTALDRSRRAVVLTLTLLGVLGAAAIWIGRHLIATLVLGDAGRADAIGWLSIAVGVTVAAGSQGATLNGLRRLRDLALMMIVSAVVGTVAGIALLYIYGENGVIAFLIAIPLVAGITGQLIVSRIPTDREKRGSVREALVHGFRLGRLGVPFLISLIILSVGLLTVRSFIHARLGAVQLGFFEAAWSLSTAYLGAIIVAMSTDFYPRLSTSMKDPEAARSLVNEQTQVALWLCAPACIFVIGFAPLIVTLFFSSKFAPSADLLRLLVLGDILKILSWPLGYVLLASGSGARFVIKEALAVGAFVALTWLGVSRFGIAGPGAGYIAMFAIYLLLTYHWARDLIAMQWSVAVKKDAVILVVGALMAFGATRLSDAVGMMAATLLTAAVGYRSLGHLAHALDERSRLGRLALLARRFPGFRAQ